MKIMIQKQDKALVENITEWVDGIYTVHFKGYEDAIWCTCLSDIYLAIKQFKETGRVNTNECGRSLREHLQDTT